MRQELKALRAEVDQLKSKQQAEIPGEESTKPTATKKQPTQVPVGPKNFGSKFHQWISKDCAKIPDKDGIPYPPAVFKDGKVYVGGGDRYSGPECFLVHEYDLESDSWVDLPQATQNRFSMAVINDMVTLVGGKEKNGGPTGSLLCYQGDGASGKWIRCLPPMPTARLYTATVMHEESVIVIGGARPPQKQLTTVEVLNTETMEWSTVSPLPEPVVHASAAVAGGKVYVLNGEDARGNQSAIAFSCSVSELLESSDSASIWKKLPDAPVARAAITNLFETPVAFGGWQGSHKAIPQQTIHAYSDEKDKWNVLGYMSVAHGDSCVVPVGAAKVMIIGGREGPAKNLKKAEIVELKQ